MPASGKLYADLAPYYDQFCAEVDYDQQCDFARRAFALFTASSGRDYLDLACGTGAHMHIMQSHGFVPTGLDNSADMLEQAARRCPQAQFMLSDLAAFEQDEAFDLITCFLYSMHYSHPVSAFEESLRRSWQALKPGGVLIFNAVDRRGIKNDQGIATRVVDGQAELHFQSGWYYRGEGEVLDLRLTITREHAGSRQQWRDHHTMTAITFEQINALLYQLGYEVHMLEHDYGALRLWAGNGFNALFVACKPV